MLLSSSPSCSWLSWLFSLLCIPLPYMVRAALPVPLPVSHHSQTLPSVTCLCCPGPESCLVLAGTQGNPSAGPTLETTPAGSAGDRKRVTSRGNPTRKNKTLPGKKNPTRKRDMSCGGSQISNQTLCVSVDGFLDSASAFLQGRICWFLWTNSSPNTTGS